MSSTKRLLKREYKEKKNAMGSPRMRKDSEELKYMNENEVEGSFEGEDQSEDHSSRMASSSSLTHHKEEENNTTIYHVPSFLLKTYEIVDVRNLLKFYLIHLFVGQEV